jgi:hypothetical protein
MFAKATKLAEFQPVHACLTEEKKDTQFEIAATRVLTSFPPLMLTRKRTAGP